MKNGCVARRAAPSWFRFLRRAQVGGGQAFFRAERKGDELLFSVRGEKSFCPPKVSRCSSLSDECGRGLFLVDAVCLRREYSEQDGITVYMKLQ